MKLTSLHSLMIALGLMIGLNQQSRAEIESGSKQQLTLAQFNLRWFGKKEAKDSWSKASPDESRISSIRKHMTEHALMTDVLAFEEIVDVKLLAEGVLEKRYNCYSYNHKDPDHQHVVVCVKPHLKFEKAPGSRAYTLNEVDVNGELRPAVHGIVKTNSGKPLMHLIAVHLKSAPDFSEIRVKQIGVISEYIKRANTDLPTVLVGDFNTYGDDPENFSRILSANQMEEVPSPESFSWATTHESYEPAKFDRVWMSGRFADQVISQNVVGPCNQSDRRTLERYNNTVSDHCAVKTTIDMK